ncbi:MAG: autotransporter domain-containing protein, partial [Alphaproteobacteria bacterium]|nr:autotransporter domain-containing protein [Alphaproteobacteria bacterium]
LDVGAGLVTAAATTLTGTGEVNLTGAGGVTGNILGASNGVGVLNVDASATVTGDIGQSGFALASVDVATGADLTATGDIYAPTTTLNGTGALTLNGGALQTIDSAIDGGSIGAGTINIANDVAFEGAIGGTKALGKIAVNTTDTATFNATVNADDIDFNAAGALIFNFDVISDDIDFKGAAGTVDFADDADYAGDIVSTGGPSGTVNFAGDSNITKILGLFGNLGTAGKGLNTVNVDGAAGTTVDVAGTIVASNININGTGTLAPHGNLTGAVKFTADGLLEIDDGNTITGNVSGTGGSVGNLDFIGGGTITGTFGTGGNTLNTLTIGDDVEITGNTVAADTTMIGVNTLDVSAGTFTLGAGQQLSAIIFGPASNGQVTSSGAAAVNAAGGVVLARPDLTYYITNGQDFTIIDGTGGAGVNNIGANLDVTAADSLMVTFAQNTGITSDFVVTATRTPLNTLTATENAGNVGAALDIIGLDGDPILDAIQLDLQAFGEAGDNAAIENLLQSLLPANHNGAAQVAAIDAGGQAFAVNEERIAALRSGDGTSGMSAGFSANGVSLWLQGYGRSAQQDLRDEVAGYDSDTMGTAVGLDSTNLMEDGVLGLALNFSRTNADSKNVNTTGTDVDSYGVNIYGSRNFMQQVFVNGQLGYAFNKIDTARHDVGGPGVTESGDFSSNLYSAKLAAGRDYTTASSMTLTPSASVAYTRLETDGYRETGPGAGLNVENETFESMKLGVRVDAAWSQANANGSQIKPALHAAYDYEVINDNVEITSSFIGDPGGTTFNTGGPPPARGALNAGLGLTYVAPANWELSAKYDYTYKADYDAHAGVLRATAHF